MLDVSLADAILTHQIDLLRLEAGTSDRIIKLLEKMVEELRVRAAGRLTEFGKRQVDALIREAAKIINGYYGEMRVIVDDTLAGVAEVQVGHVQGLLTAALSETATLPTAAVMEAIVSDLLIQGAPSAEWWSRQSKDSAFRFAQIVRQGIAQGLTTDQIVGRIAGSPRAGIAGIMNVAKTNARALVHTSIQTVANAARVALFERNADVLDAMVWLATLDPRTCMACGTRDLHEYDVKSHAPLNGGPPWLDGPGAIHWGCRCTATVKLRKVPGMVDERASSEGPVPGGMSFGEYLDRMGHEFQDEALGKGRAELWRNKGLTLEQLLDLRGNPLTIDQLRRKYGR